MGRIISKIADYTRETDKLLLILCTVSTLYGCVAVFSATRYLETTRPIIVQALSMVLGLCVAVFISLFDYERFIKRWYIIAPLGVIPVLLTFVIGFAPEGTDDKAWLDLGITTFQPAELLKICFIITFSMHLSRVKKEINKPKNILFLCLHGAFPVVLIHLQGDDGTAIVFAAIFIAMMFAAGVSWKYFISAFTLGLISSPFLYFFILNDDQRSRIINMFNPNENILDANYQQYRARIALANGGFSGTGLFNGPLTSRGGVPEGQNDFIFVSIGEELGFIGCMLVVLLLAAICLRTIRISRICTKDSGKLICVGFFGMIFTQFIINVGMCVSVLPVIGITLPFFSAGGTSLVCIYLGVGLVLSVYLHRDSRILYLHD